MDSTCLGGSRAVPLLSGSMHSRLAMCLLDPMHLASCSVSPTVCILCFFFRQSTTFPMLNSALVAFDFTWYHIGICRIIFLENAMPFSWIPYFSPAFVIFLRSVGVVGFHDWR
ncbi:hypothetical protein L218DRAFT_758046 [Marasmius fiardii PR-910]|nr:hypothetical protein L218DRAFT_758046 [Marasmius fiardii PR-910]